jgi:hypothetical protein
MLRGNVAGWHN